MKKKGFTLIEIMITLAIFSLFVGFLYNAYFSQIRENNSFNSRLDLKYNGDKAMNFIANELRNNAIPLTPESITKIKSSTVVLCKGITSIEMEYEDPIKKELIIITIDLQLKDDTYTVTSAVNISK